MYNMPPHEQFLEGPTINEAIKLHTFRMRNSSFKGLDHALWSDDSKMKNVISLIIHKCRYARVTDSAEDFDHIANLITSRKDLKFKDYKDRKRFSCTEETERKFYQEYKQDYEDLFSCLSECSYSKNIGPTRYVTQSRLILDSRK